MINSLTGKETRQVYRVGNIIFLNLMDSINYANLNGLDMSVEYIESEPRRLPGYGEPCEGRR